MLRTKIVEFLEEEDGNNNDSSIDISSSGNNDVSGTYGIEVLLANDEYNYKIY